MSGLKVVQYPCKFDNTLQCAQCRISDSAEPRPLLVALHTWSYTWKDGCESYDILASQLDYHLIFPHFRGPNWTPEGCGSDAVVSDLEDAVAYMKQVCKVDEKRIYLMGGSGGGHASLLMAGRRPDLFSAISAWCPISDVARWHKESLVRYKNYAEHIEKACGGDPAVSAEAAFQAKLRSGLTWLANAANVCPVDIATGIHDGHKGSVPVGQAIRAYNLLAAEEDRIPEEDLVYIEEKEAVPAHLQYQGSDPAYGPIRIHLRKISQRVRLTIFEGAHDCLPGVGGEWLGRQIRGGKVDFASGIRDVSVVSELTK